MTDFTRAFLLRVQCSQRVLVAAKKWGPGSWLLANVWRVNDWQVSVTFTLVFHISYDIIVDL